MSDDINVTCHSRCNKLLNLWLVMPSAEMMPSLFDYLKRNSTPMSDVNGNHLHIKSARALSGFRGSASLEWKLTSFVPVYRSAKYSTSTHRPVFLASVCCHAFKHAIYSAISNGLILWGDS